VALESGYCVVFKMMISASYDLCSHSCGVEYCDAGDVYVNLNYALD